MTKPGQTPSNRTTVWVYREAAAELAELERLLLAPTAQRLLDDADMAILHGDTGEGPEGVGRRFAFTRGAAVRVAIRYLARMLRAEAREGKP
jgi:hypothetical protein